MLYNEISNKAYLNFIIVSYLIIIFLWYFINKTTLVDMNDGILQRNILLI